jgi:hypothetical protein
MRSKPMQTARPKLLAHRNVRRIGNLDISQGLWFGNRPLSFLDGCSGRVRPAGTYAD